MHTIRLWASFFMIGVFSAAFGGMISVTLEPGEHYIHKFLMMQFGPQFAVWLEKEDGTPVRYLFVTKWSAKTFGKDAVTRPSALPVWRNRGKDAVAKNLKVDAIATATPKANFTKTIVLDSLEPGRYRVRLEVNNSFDYNEVYKKELKKNDPNYNDVNGQPSLVYSADVVIGGGNQDAALILTGCGNVRGEDGEIDAADSSITTARAILKRVLVTYTP